MKECFGNFGFFFEDRLNVDAIREKCYSCEDYDLSLIHI